MTDGRRGQREAVVQDARGTWTPDEARGRAAFVLGVAADATTDEARAGYRRQLRAHAGDSEHARTARRTLMAAWAVWNRTADDAVADPVAGRDRDAVEDDVIDLVAEDRRLAEDSSARELGAPPSEADTSGLLDGIVEVVEVVRDGPDGGEVRVRHRVWQPPGSVLPGLPVDDARVRRLYEQATRRPSGRGASALV